MHTNTLRFGYLLLLCGALVVAPVGCKSKQVDENQTVAAFKTDVESRLSGFESRLSHVKSEMGEREVAVRDKVETLTEQAEEKIETLRDSTVPKLDDVTSDEARDNIKETINAALADIQSAIEKAESTLARAKTAREKYSEDTEATLDSLHDRYEDLEDRAGNYEGDARAKIDMALESAEEAIQQARSSLDKYSNAAEDQADRIHDNVDSLLSDARDELDKAADAMKK
jgi:ElaB/YqjD/DUF883 family membrane-anchored ribosome-binding protein